VSGEVGAVGQQTCSAQRKRLCDRGFGYGIAATAVGGLLLFGPGAGTAFADEPAGGPAASGTTAAGPQHPGPKAKNRAPVRQPRAEQPRVQRPRAERPGAAGRADTDTATAAPTAHRVTTTPKRTPAARTATADAVVDDSVSPEPPQPLSPVAQVLDLPAQVANTVMQLFDITTAANSPRSPIDLAPLNDAFFAAFREGERLAGLQRTPPAQPVVPTLTYTGPTTRPTPTVAEFLDASAAGYVLGGTPGGMVPFTVNGFQMSATNTLTGMAGDVWATPEGQLIIAYQGTSGGTHALFNPLMVISQLLADTQMIFTDTTPVAFDDAVDFARRVQAEAALQGYDADDIFVTGHSLGGWQAQYVAQQTGLAGIGFEAPGMNTTVPGNGVDSLFVTIGTYGSPAPYMSTDLPGLQPFMPPFVAGGGSKPHYGSMIMVGDPAAMTPFYNAAPLWGSSLIGSALFLADFLGNFGQFHMVGVQAHNLDVDVDPGIVPWLGTKQGPVHVGYGELTIPELLQAASDDGILLRP
jgi:hypothetical protein